MHKTNQKCYTHMLLSAGLSTIAKYHIHRLMHIRLFPKLQGNVCLIPNMHFIMKGKNRPHPQIRNASIATSVPLH